MCVSVSETADLLGFSHNFLKPLQRMVRKRENIQSESVLCKKMPCLGQRSEENDQWWRKY